MEPVKKYYPTDLACYVWPRQSAPAVLAGTLTWEEAAREAWAMAPAKADRVSVLAAVHDDVVMDAWSVVGAQHDIIVPAGKSRRVSRSKFTTVSDSRLSYLVGSPSTVPRRRNPQTTFELRDLPGSEALLQGDEPAAVGIVQLGAIILTVASAGRAHLQLPAGTILTVETET
jgi:hypothetical protein